MSDCPRLSLSEDNIGQLQVLEGMADEVTVLRVDVRSMDVMHGVHVWCVTATLFDPVNSHTAHYKLVGLRQGHSSLLYTPHPLHPTL